MVWVSSDPGMVRPMRSFRFSWCGCTAVAVALFACGPSGASSGDDEGDSVGDTDSVEDGGSNTDVGETSGSGPMDEAGCEIPECGIDLACGVVHECGTMVDCGPCQAVVVDDVEPVTSGQVVDVSDPASPKAAGVFAFSGEILPQPELGRVLMLSPYNLFDGTSVTLRVLDPATFTELQSTPLMNLDADTLDDFVSPDGVVLGVIAHGFDDASRLHIIPNPFTR
jgi:hypothetical protein